MMLHMSKNLLSRISCVKEPMSSDSNRSALSQAKGDLSHEQVIEIATKISSIP